LNTFLCFLSPSGNKNNPGKKFPRMILYFPGWVQVKKNGVEVS
jgi:hypothetical protein